MPLRHAIVRISYEALADLLKQREGRQLVFSGLPDDARLVGVGTQVYFHHGQLALKFESASFPESAEGMALPQIEVSVKAIDVPRAGREFF